LILQNEKPAEAEKLLREYLDIAPMNSEYPRPWVAHYWLGRFEESRKNPAAARGEYQAALKLNGKYKPAQEALKQLGKD
jgi:TolA-binding protein